MTRQIYEACADRRCNHRTLTRDPQQRLRLIIRISGIYTYVLDAQVLKRSEECQIHCTCESSKDLCYRDNIRTKSTLSAVTYTVRLLIHSVLRSKLTVYEIMP